MTRPTSIVPRLSKLTIMNKETSEQRAERKAIYIARVTAHFNTPQTRKEASDKWEEANKE